MRIATLISVIAVCAAFQADLAHAQDPECRFGPPEDAVPYDPSQPESLEGEYLLTEVLTSWDEGREWTSRFSLRVATPEEQEAALQTGIGHFRRHLTHKGVHNWSDEYAARIVEADGPIVYLGCRDCLDAHPTVLWIAVMSDIGLWGLWRNYQTGIGAVVDSLGNYLPDPAGYFCARRIEAPSR